MILPGVSESSYKDLLLCLLSVKETSCQYFQPRHSERRGKG